MFVGGDIQYSRAVLKNAAFWPDVAVADFQQQRKIPAHIDELLVIAALLTAMGEINTQLENFTHRQLLAGVQTAQEVKGPVAVSDGIEINLVVAQYKKALFARAKADLLGEFASVARREEHTNRDAPETKASLLAEAAFSLRSIQGMPRVGVYLL